MNLDSPIEHPTYRDSSVADLIDRFEVGDRIHIELTHREGRIPWHSDWVQDAGEGYVQTSRFRVEVTDRDAYGRGAVTLFEKQGDEYIAEEWTESLNGVERTPRETFEEDDWFQWEISVCEVPGGGASTDTTVFPEAPSREIAKEAAKRWANMDNGYIGVIYQEDAIEPPEDRPVAELS